MDTVNDLGAEMAILIFDAGPEGVGGWRIKSPASTGEQAEIVALVQLATSIRNGATRSHMTALTRTLRPSARFCMWRAESKRIWRSFAMRQLAET